MFDGISSSLVRHPYLACATGHQKEHLPRGAANECASKGVEQGPLKRELLLDRVHHFILDSFAICLTCSQICICHACPCLDDESNLTHDRVGSSKKLLDFVQGVKRLHKLLFDAFFNFFDR